MVSIAIVGQGYVGLPLAVEAARADFKVIGIDNDLNKVLQLNSGVSPVEGIDSNELKVLLKSGAYSASQNYELIKGASIVLICVPTPLDEIGAPDLSFVINATENIAKNISKDTLVILESSVAPGTTRNIVFETIRKFSGLSAEEFKVAFSPERIDPLNKTWNLQNTPKIIAGLTDSAENEAKNFYSSFVKNVFVCQTLEIAETAKLLENSFRLINISFINELAIYCNSIGVPVSEVIKAASTKPYGFMAFTPSSGAGGHCIPVDPIYLSNSARINGTPIVMIEIAAQINTKMPSYYISQANKIIGSLAGKKILIIGISYKPNISDLRESSGIKLIQSLREKGSEVFWHDELAKKWLDEKSTPISNGYDLAILVTPHDDLNLSALGNVPIIDTRGFNR
jgi:UDP-N-acetyl-D-glucosamine dehydrogenase